MPRNSDKIIEKAIIEYWRESVPQDVIVFFYQKYSHEAEWEFCKELVMANSSYDYDSMTFLNDFCEGQTDVKGITVVPLEKVTSYYAEHAIKK